MAGLCLKFVVLSKIVEVADGIKLV